MEEAVKQLTDIPAINRFLSYCRVRTVPSKTALIHAGDLEAAHADADLHAALRERFAFVEARIPAALELLRTNGIAEEAVKLDSQHETFEDIAIDVEGDAASYAGTWRLFHNGKELRVGRAWYTIVRRDGKWLIASLVWYRE